MNAPASTDCMDFMTNVIVMLISGKRRYNLKLWKLFSDVFNVMPVSALVDDKILCMHGGLSPQLESFDQILNLPRPIEIPDRGLMCDILWSDPEKNVTGWG